MRIGRGGATGKEWFIGGKNCLNTGRQLSCEACGVNFEAGDEDCSPDTVSRSAFMRGAVATCASLTLAQPSAQAAGLDLTDLKKFAAQVDDIIDKKLASGELSIPFPDITRLVLHDAITYDSATKTGGLDGSIRFELNRPENVGLEPAVRKLESLQKDLQKETGLDISFADTEAFAGKRIVFKEFYDTLCAKIAKDKKCETAYNAYGNKPDKLRLGREDASEAGPEGRVPWVGSSPDDFKAAFKKLKLYNSDLCSFAPALLEDEAKAIEFLKQDKDLAGSLEQLEKSKATTTRTTYEVSVYETLDALANAKRLNPKIYGVVLMV